jgi:hypothetical protein
MALDVNKLAADLRRFLDPDDPSFAWPPTRDAAITLWSNAYDTYGSDAVDYSGDAVASKNPTGFRSALAAAFSYTWTAGEAANAFRDAWIAYWTGGVFSIGTVPPPTGACANAGGNGIFSTELSSIVTLINGAPLRAALLAIFQDLGIDGADKADEIAAAFHAATTTNIQVTISGLDTTPPPTGPLPIVNVCTVF